MSPGADSSDPAVRAERALRRVEQRQKQRRWLVAFGLLVAAVAMPLLTGKPGSLVGGLVESALCVGLAVAAWPWAWSVEEREHHHLEAIWREARTDALADVAWERYAAWAVADEAKVQLLRLTCLPYTDHAPRRLRSHVVESIDAAAIADAAQAMQVLREACEDRELAARQALSDAQLLGEQQADDEALAAVDIAVARAQREDDEQMRREVEAEDAADRRAQAAALAEALRRP